MRTHSHHQAMIHDLRFTSIAMRLRNTCASVGTTETTTAWRFPWTADLGACGRGVGGWSASAMTPDLHRASALGFVVDRRTRRLVEGARHADVDSPDGVEQVMHVMLGRQRALRLLHVLFGP